MKSIETTRALVTIDGTAIKMAPDDPTVFTVGKAVAKIIQLSRSNKMDPVKAWDLACSFHKELPVQLDKADLNIIKDLVREDQNFDLTLRGQLIELLEKSPEVVPTQEKE